MMKKISLEELIRSKSVQVKSSTTRLPKFWVGYIIAAVFSIFAVASAMAAIAPDQLKMLGELSGIVGLVYWIACVCELHDVCNKLDASYPISQQKAFWFHSIPAFNMFYWIFKWPAVMLAFISSRNPKCELPKWVPGGIIFAGILAGINIDGAVGLVLISLAGHLTVC